MFVLEMNAARGLTRLNILRRVCTPSQNANFKVMRHSSNHSIDHRQEHGHGHVHNHDGHDEGHIFNYRLACFKPVQNRTSLIYGHGFMTFMWWWILWHIFTEPDVLFGTESPATYPELWTDEELGIPPDDE